MVHVFATLGFALVGIASAVLIWSMVVANVEAIGAALGLRTMSRRPQVAGRRVRVRSVQPVMVRLAEQRRVA